MVAICLHVSQWMNTGKNRNLNTLEYTMQAITHFIVKPFFYFFAFSLLLYCICIINISKFIFVAFLIIGIFS